MRLDIWSKSKFMKITGLQRPVAKQVSFFTSDGDKFEVNYCYQSSHTR